MTYISIRYTKTITTFGTDRIARIITSKTIMITLTPLVARTAGTPRTIRGVFEYYVYYDYYNFLDKYDC